MMSNNNIRTIRVSARGLLKGDSDGGPAAHAVLVINSGRHMNKLRMYFSFLLIDSISEFFKSD